MRYIGYTDGGVRGGNPGTAAWGYWLEGPGGLITTNSGLMIGKASNNQAEYAALLKLLYYLMHRQITGALIRSDSQLMVNQVNGVWTAQHDSLRAHWAVATSYLDATGSKLEWIPREQNKHADALVEALLDKYTGRSRNGKKVRNN